MPGYSFPSDTRNVSIFALPKVHVRDFFVHTNPADQKDWALNIDHAKPGTKVHLVVRGKPLPAEIVTLPFVPARFHRASK